MKKENSKKRKNTKYDKVALIISRGLFFVIGTLLFSLLYFVFKANIFPLKYIIMFIVFAIIILGVFWFLLWRKGELWFKIVVSVIGTLLCVLLVYCIFTIDTTANFIKNLLSNEYEKITYNVVVLKNSDYDEIDDLEEHLIALCDENSDNIIEELSKTISFDDQNVSDVGELSDGLYNKSFSAIIISNDMYEMLKELNDDVSEEEKNDRNFEEDTKVVFTFEVETKVTEEEVEVINIKEEPFILYISGIDQWGNVNNVRGRSDVNMLVVVNPMKHKILLVNTPRDYYVNLHNKKGLPDKLTHAGVYGIDVSMATLEDLYDTNINYFMRVNFDTLIKLVDEIDGIDVYSDTSFNSYHIKGWTVKKGENHLDGKKALAYSRERYAYITGDRHRGQNQQDVISAIIKKCTSSKILLTKYNKILDKLDGSFQSNMPTAVVNDIIKYQLDKMPSWDVESISVSGSDASEYTYSYGTSQKLYVMKPYQKDVNNAKSKIKEVLNDK